MDNLNTIMTIPVAEYKELIEFKIKTEYETRLRDVMMDCDLKLQAREKELDDARECTTYWYGRAHDMEKENAKLKAQLSELLPSEVV